MEQTLAEALEVPFSQRTPEYERYLIKGEIGEGGMGRVLHAHDQKLNRDVAIKVMIPDEGRDENDAADLRARFYREAKIVAMLDHPNVLRMLDYSGQDAPVPFIVTELLDGIDLDHVIDRGPVPEGVATSIAHYLAAGLSHAHSLQIVHRDVKPQNVFIESDGRVVLIDFGVAKGVRSTNTRVTLMASRTKVVGTALFSSPEQVRSTAAPTTASDLFSLGAVLYYTMSQVVPFPGRTPQEVLHKLVSDEPLDLRKLVACSDRCWQLIERLLQKSPEARPPIAEVIATLKELSFDGAFVSLQDVIASYVLGLETGDVNTVVTQTPAEAELTATDPAGVPLSRSDVNTQTSFVVAKTERRERTAENSMRTVMRMRRRRPLIIAAVILLVGLAVGARMLSTKRSAPPVVAVATGSAKLRVLVKPWGKVSIDGVERGTTPAFRVAELPLGRHEVFVTNPAFGDRQVSVVLPEPNREETLVVDFTAPQ